MTAYTWDNRNRMTRVVSPTGTTSYTYDDENIRTSSTVGNETTRFVVDSNRDYAQVLAEYRGGSLQASYVYGLDLVSQKRGTAESFYLVDGLGSTRGLTNASGGLTDTYTYDAFGNLVGSAGGTQNSYLFAGEQLDAGTGDYYLRQRYYDSSTGRFTRRDTFEGDVNSPITLHKYLYGNGNPVNYIDPTGLFSIGEALGGVINANHLFWPSAAVVVGAVGTVGGFGTLEDLNDFLEFYIPYFGSFGEPDISIEKQLQGKGQLKDLRDNPNWDEEISINEALKKTPNELEEMKKNGEISAKGYKQIKKAFEGRDLGKRGKKKDK